MSDRFAAFSDAPHLPSAHVFAVVPSDGTALPHLPKGLYVGTGGSITLRTPQSEADVVLKNVVSGQILPIRASHVRATGTTAADIVGLA